MQLLNEVAVKPGTFLYIPAGTVHAILGGILVAEIQRNSNTTYRLYDWDKINRNGKKRKLHIKDALDTIHAFAAETGPESFHVIINLKGNQKTLYSDSYVNLNKGDAVLVPPKIRQDCLEGNMLTLSIHTPACKERIDE